jgi:hypothetical protein
LLNIRQRDDKVAVFLVVQRLVQEFGEDVRVPEWLLCQAEATMACLHAMRRGLAGLGQSGGTGNART